MNILFSPIGNTDPIANDLDGAMLHICRHYPIDHVVMYMSKDILKHHRADNRYVDSLERLGALIGRDITYEIIERPELENVQVFDGFIKDFGAMLTDIHAAHPGAKVYLNVSSGTPAMKSALQILAAYREYNYIPIQVAGPGYRQNRKPFDINTAFDDDLDNLPESPNRCSVSTNLDLLSETKKRMISALIDKYDYSGAYTITKDMPDINGRFCHLLKAADLRSKFELDAARKEFAAADYDKELYSNYAEYLLILWLKNEKNEIADFLRAITPLTGELIKAALLVCCGFDINDYAENTDRGLKWSLTKVRAAAKSGNSLAEKALRPLEYQDGRTVYPLTMKKVFASLSQDEELKKIFDHLIDVEETRNPIAHTLKSINRAEMHETGIGSVNSILNDIFSACLKTRFIQIQKGFTNTTFRKYFFEDYIRLSEDLKKLLE